MSDNSKSDTEQSTVKSSSTDRCLMVEPVAVPTGATSAVQREDREIPEDERPPMIWHVDDDQIPQPTKDNENNADNVQARRNSRIPNNLYQSLRECNCFKCSVL